MGVELHHRAKFILLDQLLHGEEIRIPSSILIYADKLPRLLGDIDELLGFGGCRDEGLFDQNVLAGLESRFREMEVSVWRSGDYDNVD